jgi:hypothetical protein
MNRINLVNKPRLKVTIAFLLLLAASLACNFSASTANLQNPRMARDYEGNDPTQIFGQEDTFYCVADLQNAPDDTAVRAVWTAVSVEGEDPDTFIDQSELTTGSGTLHFELSNDGLWPVGTYKVELYLNDQLEETLEFEVQ